MGRFLDKELPRQVTIARRLIKMVGLVDFCSEDMLDEIIREVQMR